MPALRREMWWLIFNAVSLGAFLVLASGTWLEPELRGVPGASGGAGVVWTLTALPVLLGTFFLDLIWLWLATTRAIKFRDRQPMWVALGTAAVWLVAASYDQFRH